MDSFDKLQQLCARLDSIEKTGEWLSENLEGKDEVVSQSGKLLVALAEDVRHRALALVSDLERELLQYHSFKTKEDTQKLLLN